MKTRLLRDKKNLYKPALEGLKKDVIDVDIPFDQSRINDLIIDTDNNDVEFSANKIIESLN